MTVSYNSTGYVRPFGFGRLLFRWRGSIWKAIWVELMIWLAFYYMIATVYWVLPSHNKRQFEKLVVDWEAYNLTTTTVITFSLGFYTTIGFNRWWDSWQNVPWIDSMAMALNAAVHPTKEESGDEAVVVRRTVVRYLNLAAALVYQTVSERVGAEHSGLESLQKLGLLTGEEAHEIKSTPFDTHVYFIPIMWAVNIVTAETRKGRVNSRLHEVMLDRIEKYRYQLGVLLSYKWIPVPLVYTHVVTAAVYFHFAIELISGQMLDPAQNIPGHTIMWGFPMFDTIMFVVLVGWLKSAELIKHPFGLDEDAFEIMWILKRNIDVGFNMVTHRHAKFPPLTKDRFWGVERPLGLSPLRPNVNTLSFGKEHKHISPKVLSAKRESYVDPSEIAVHSSRRMSPVEVYVPPMAQDINRSFTEEAKQPLI